VPTIEVPSDVGLMHLAAWTFTGGDMLPRAITIFGVSVAEHAGWFGISDMQWTRV
jgi:hypothetical protein